MLTPPDEDGLLDVLIVGAGLSGIGAAAVLQHGAALGSLAPTPSDTPGGREGGAHR